MTHTKTTDWSELKRLAEALSGREWYVLGPPWAGFTETFTVLRGSPDPHVGVAILETVPNEEADETDDHYEQEALAKWLQHADPNAFLQLIAENAALKAQVAEERDWQNEIRKVCKEAMGGNTTFIDDDVARAITALKSQRDEMAEMNKLLFEVFRCAEIADRRLVWESLGFGNTFAEEIDEAIMAVQRARTALNKETTDG